jgi:hypothetical protein
MGKFQVYPADLNVVVITEIDAPKGGLDANPSVDGQTHSAQKCECKCPHF